MFLFNPLKLPKLVQYDILDLTGMLSVKRPPGAAMGACDGVVSDGQPHGTCQHRCNTGMAQRKGEPRCDGGVKWRRKGIPAAAHQCAGCLQRSSPSNLPAAKHSHC